MAGNLLNGYDWRRETAHNNMSHKEAEQRGGQTFLTDKKTRANSHLISVPEYPIMFAFENWFMCL